MCKIRHGNCLDSFDVTRLHVLECAMPRNWTESGHQTISGSHLGMWKWTTFPRKHEVAWECGSGQPFQESMRSSGNVEVDNLCKKALPLDNPERHSVKNFG